MIRLQSIFTKGRSIGFKISSMLGIAVLTGFAVTATMQVNGMRNRMSSQFQTDSIKLTELLAIQASGGLQWKKADAIERADADFAADPSANLAAVATFDAEAKPVTTFKSTQFPAYDLSNAVKIDADALAKGTTVTAIADHHYLVVAPVVAGKNKDRVGTMAIAWSTDHLQQSVAAAVRDQALVAVVAVLVLIGVMVLLLSRIVSKPLSTMTDTMKRLAAGDLEVEVPARGRNDEIGEMAAAVQVFKDNAVEKVRLDEEPVERERRAAEEATRQAAAGTQEVSSNIAGVSRAANDTGSAAEQIKGAAGELSRQSETLRNEVQKFLSSVRAA